jgi:mono/diheme cytochrome c family protein
MKAPIPILTGVFCLGLPLAGDEESDKKQFETDIQPFFKKHCIKCHGPEKSKGDVRLNKFLSVIADDYEAEHWQEVLDVLNGAEMPPKKEPQPGTEEWTGSWRS